MLLVKDADGKYYFNTIKELSLIKKTLFVQSQDNKGIFHWLKIKAFNKNGIQQIYRITTKTGRTIDCTKNHQFVVKKASQIKGTGYRKIKVLSLNELNGSEYLYTNVKIDIGMESGGKNEFDDGFVIGFYLAEGCYINSNLKPYVNSVYSKSARKRWGEKPRDNYPVGIQLSCGITDIERGYLERYKKYDIKIRQYGNSVSVQSRDKKLLSFIQEYVEGKKCNTKHLTNKAFNRTKSFLDGVLGGFLAGDGHYDAKNNRWVSGVKPNHKMVNSFELICRILGYDFRKNDIRKTNCGNKLFDVQTFQVRMDMSKRTVVMGCITDKIDKIKQICFNETYDIGIEPMYCGMLGNNQYKQKKVETTEQKKKKYNHLYFLGNGIWNHNSNCMPSSAKDRFTVDFEYLFFFSKNKKYYFEQQFDKTITQDDIVRDRDTTKLNNTPGRTRMAGLKTNNYDFKNKRTVWTINPKSFSEAHFAVYPEELCETPIKAGCPEFVCKKCGKPRERILNKTFIPRQTNDKPENYRAIQEEKKGNRYIGIIARKGVGHNEYEFKGYTDCGCNAEYTGGIVYDPFAGSGTTGLVAHRLNRNYILSEISKEYCEIAEKRLRTTKQIQFA